MEFGARPRGSFLLVCPDAMMPVMGGLDALRLMRLEAERRGRGQATKFIMTTGSDDSATIDKAFKELCDAYIVKPIDPAELLDIIYCLCRWPSPPISPRKDSQSLSERKNNAPSALNAA